MSARPLLVVTLAGVGLLAASATGGSASFTAAEPPAAISAGTERTCARTAAGAVRCWGVVDVHEERAGPVNDISVIPDGVKGLTSGTQAVDAGGTEECALDAGGGAECWGWDDRGQLGDGQGGTGCADEPCFYADPVQVSGLSSGVQQIATGGSHVCALTTGGGLECWGANAKGQVGDGTTDDRLAPVGVSGLSSGVAAVTAGGSHSCALTTGGGVECWGANESGQLGDGTTTNSSTPVNVSGLSSGIAAIAAGGSHTCALTTSGGVKCWGDNKYGQLGDGTTQTSPTPVDVSGLSSGVAAIAVGGKHTCALLSAGGAECWGDNEHGQLGVGTTTNQATPVAVSGLASGVTAVAAGGSHTCALTSAAEIECWGDNSSGELGDGTTTARLAPTSVLWGPVCLVPRLEGTPLAAAKKSLVKHGCRSGTVYRAHARYVRKGHVISVWPYEGSYFSRGKKVDLLVSMGKAPSGHRGGKGPRGSKVLRFPGAVVGLSADAPRLAVHIAHKGCHRLVIWQQGRGLTTIRPACGGSYNDKIVDFALAGTQVGWVSYDSGNGVYCYLLTATVAHPKATHVPFCSVDGDNDYLVNFTGDGPLLVFNSYGTVWRLRSRSARPITSGTVTSVDTGRIAVIESDGSVGIYQASGKRVGHLPVQADSAKLDGSMIVVRSGRSLEPYKLAGQPAGTAHRLQGGPFADFKDVAGGIALYSMDGTLHLLRVKDGKDVTVGTPYHAGATAIESSGLFYSSGTRVIFVPMSAVRRLFR